jgi:hypothetical protein
MSPIPVFDLDDMQFSPTAALFEGGPRAGAGVSMFVVRTRDSALLVVSVHEAGAVEQTFLGRDPA